MKTERFQISGGPYNGLTVETPWIQQGKQSRHRKMWEIVFNPNLVMPRVTAGGRYQVRQESSNDYAGLLVWIDPSDGSEPIDITKLPTV